jgi:hypothetical protein
MDPAGMVHALDEIQRLLKPDGVLINLMPLSDGSFIKALQGGRILFSERRRETDNPDVLLAEQAIAQAVERKLYVVDATAEYDFLKIAPTVSELRAHRKVHNAFDKSPREGAVETREDALFAQVEVILQAAGAGAEVAMHSRIRSTRLKSLK